MPQPTLELDDVPDDPTQAAERRAVMWLVTRIRSREDALDALRVTRECLLVSSGGRESVSGSAQLRSALALVSDAVGTWDEPATADAERLNVWEAVEAHLARASRKPIRDDRAACFEAGRLYFAALREAYTIQKQGNATAARWGSGARRC